MGFLFKASKSLGPLSPRQLLAKLAAFQDTFVAANTASALPTSATKPWESVSGTWGITTNKAYAVTPGASYPVAAFDAKSESAVVKATGANNGAGYGVSFWVTDANNWWGAHTTKSSYTAAPYSCPSGGTLSGSNCNYTYGASQGSYPVCPGDWTFHAACYFLQDGVWVGQVGPAWYPNGVYSCPSGGSLSGSTCYVSYAATATTWYKHDVKVVKKTSGSVVEQLTATVANVTSNSDYIAYVEAQVNSAGNSSGVNISAQMTSGGTVLGASVSGVTSGRAKKHGLMAGPSTLNATTEVETFNYS
jgi:hypothetical protein